MTTSPITTRPEMVSLEAWAAYDAAVADAAAMIAMRPDARRYAHRLLEELPGTRRERSCEQQVDFAAANAVLRGEL